MQLMSNFDSAGQTTVLEKFTHLPLMRICRPAMQDAKMNIATALMLQNMKAAMQQCKKVNRTSNLKTRQTVVRIISSSEIADEGLASAMGRIHGINRRVLAKEAKTQPVVVPREGLLYLGQGHKSRDDHITQYVKDSILQFWELASMPSSNVKYKRRLRVSPKVYESHIVHFLNMSQVSIIFLSGFPLWLSFPILFYC